MLYVDSKYIKLISSRLRNFKQKDSNLWNFSCPICGDSKKNLSKARGYVFPKGNNLFYRCHNCGAGMSIGNLIKNVDPTVHKEYTLEKYKTGEDGAQNTTKLFDIKAPRFDKLEVKSYFEHAESCDKLPDGHFCLEYVKNRKIPTEFYSKLFFAPDYKKFVDGVYPTHGKELDTDARLVIPFYDKYNELIAVSGRALEKSSKKLRYVTIRTNDSTDKLIYGIDRIDLEQTVKIVEGPIDSLFLKNCVASGDASLLITAKNIDSSEKILIFDNEPRNKQIVKMMEDAIKSNQKIVIWPNTIQGKDINEMVMNGLSPDEIEDIISKNTFNGLEAQAKFIFWKKV